MPTCPARPRPTVLASALLLALTAQLATTQVQAQPAAPDSDHDSWFSEQLRRYRSYPHLQHAFRLMQANRLTEAARELERTLAIDPGSQRACLTYLDVMLRQQHYRAATEQAGRCLSRWPGEPHALAVRAQARSQLGRKAEASRDYEAVYRNDQAQPADRALAAGVLAEWALAHNRPERALAPLALALGFADTCPLRLLQARAFSALGRVADAERAYERALSLAAGPGERVTALWALANLALARGDTARALPYLQRVSELAPGDLHAARQLVYAWSELGRHDEAALQAKALFDLSGAAEDAYLLGTVQTARHAPQEAAAAYAQACRASDPALRARALMALGYSAQAAGRDAQARAAFAQAVGLPGADAAKRALRALTPAAPRASPPASAPAPPSRAHALAREAYAALAAHQSARARRLFERALEMDDQAPWRAQLAEVYRRDGELARARDTLAGLAEPDGPQLRQLATLSLALGDVQAGLEFLGRAARRSNDANDYLRLARAALEAGQGGLALQAYRVTQAKIGELAPAEQNALLAELGNAYLKNGQEGRALATLDAAYRQAPSLALALQLAELERRRGALDAAQARLAAVDGASLDLDDKRTWYATRAELARQAGGPAASMELLREGVREAPDGKLHYQLGMAALAAGERALAREQLLQVRMLEPDNWPATLQLAYVCQAQHDLGCAVDAFESVASVRPDVDGLAEALGYAYTELGDNERAVAWFKRAIDRLDRPEPEPEPARAAGGDSGPRPPPPFAFRKISYRPGGAPSPAEGAQPPARALPVSPPTRSDAAPDPQAGKREALRQQIGAMTRGWQLNAYQSARNGENQQGVGRGAGSGALFSQGGVEFQARVPGLGYRDGRVLQVESRLLWGNHPGTLAIDSRTLQGTVGIAYKPFKDQDGYLRLERLLKIGSQSQNNWLLHGSWGMADGWGWNPVASHWNYSTFYVDAGVMLQHEQTRSLYLEARQGHSFALGGRTVLTPHVVLAGRAQRPDPEHASYVEAGAGLALKTSFNGSRYVAERFSAELLLQYRKPIASRGGGWALSLVAQF